MGCQGEEEKFNKMNVVLELESLKAWVAKGGKFDKKECCQVGSQSMVCPGGGGIFDKRNVVR